jgi:hypothetical protein
MRFILAFSCFFRLLFGLRLSPRAADYLPEGARAALPPAKPDTSKKASEETKPPKQKAPADEKPIRPAAAERRTSDSATLQREGALAMLGLLQREGRLIDFLQESIDSYDDSDIGAAVRDIHRGCRKVLEAHFGIEPVMPGEEEESVNVPKGFDPTEIRLIGNVDGEPPFKGVLRHHGWRATQVDLPTLTEGVDRHVLAPAEVEVA